MLPTLRRKEMKLCKGKWRTCRRKSSSSKEVVRSPKFTPRSALFHQRVGANRAQRGAPGHNGVAGSPLKASWSFACFCLSDPSEIRTKKSSEKWMYFWIHLQPSRNLDSFLVFLESFPIQIIWKIFFLEYMMAKTTEIGKIRIGKYYWMTHTHTHIYIYIYVGGTFGVYFVRSMRTIICTIYGSVYLQACA